MCWEAAPPKIVYTNTFLTTLPNLSICLDILKVKNYKGHLETKDLIRNALKYKEIPSKPQEKDPYHHHIRDFEYLYRYELQYLTYMTYPEHFCPNLIVDLDSHKMVDGIHFGALVAIFRQQAASIYGFVRYVCYVHFVCPKFLSKVFQVGF